MDGEAVRSITLICPLLGEQWVDRLKDHKRTGVGNDSSAMQLDGEHQRRHVPHAAGWLLPAVSRLLRIRSFVRI